MALNVQQPKQSSNMFPAHPSSCLFIKRFTSYNDGMLGVYIVKKHITFQILKKRGIF